MRLNDQVDFKGPLTRSWARLLDVVNRLGPKKAQREHKGVQQSPPTDPTLVPANASPETPYPSYWSLNLSGQSVAPKPATLPWFLSGVPEQYHQHYQEWMSKQPSGAPIDYSTYLTVTGSYTTGYRSYPYFVSGWNHKP